jgi:transcriptional regulator with AAA-type ATPase domain
MERRLQQLKSVVETAVIQAKSEGYTETEILIEFLEQTRFMLVKEQLKEVKNV